MRKDGYYWCKSSERIGDHGGPCEDEWVINEYEQGVWLVHYTPDDKDFKEIDETPITRIQHTLNKT